jgi:cation:H+ antiporter
MLLDLSAIPLAWLIAAFALAGACILLAGTRLARQADQIADRTGMGEALTGAIFLGATTSLPGSIVSVVSASFGHTELAVSNAIGGIAAQTAFLGLADITYRRANLEHAAASFTNLTQGAVLVVLLAIPLVAQATPPLTVLGVSPATLALFGAYAFGLRISAEARAEPMWRPRDTAETKVDRPDTNGNWRGWRSWLMFACVATIAGSAGFVLAETAVELSRKTGLSESAIGALFTAVTTSLPELVTSIAAVRQGALTLAVGGIIGGNAFDVLFLAFADIAYRDGSIYHTMIERHVFLVAVSIVMTGVLLLGLLRRETHGFAGIGFESALVLGMYLGAAVLVIA